MESLLSVSKPLFDLVAAQKPAISQLKEPLNALDNIALLFLLFTSFGSYVFKSVFKSVSKILLSN